MVLIETVLLLIAIVILVYFWNKNNYEYWRKRGVPFEKPTPLIGSIKDVFTLKISLGLHFSKIYSDPVNADEPVVGLYIMNKPGLLIREPEIIKSIIIKDFNKFSNRSVNADPHRDALGSNNLFFMRNPSWREVRVKISPVFSSGKIKQMYSLLEEIGHELENHLERSLNNEKNFIAEIKDLCALFTTDMLATIAFGIKANSLQNPKSEFFLEGKRFFDFNLSKAYNFFVSFFLPQFVSILRIQVFDEKFSNFVRKSIGYVMSERERTGTIRNDLIDILVGLKKEAALDTSGKHFANNNDILVAQAAVFITAGFETSASTMSFALYELVKSPEHLNRLRREICDALLEGDGQISYEKIVSLEYLSMVVDEVLRLYPVLPFLNRQYENHKDNGDFSLRPYSNVTVPHGMPVFIPIFGIQRDPKYWPNPNKFDPERFSPENKKTINPMTYLPFGSGPHNCIGLRLGLLQAKIGLFYILKNYTVEMCPDTPKEIHFEPKAIVLQSVAGIPLKVIQDNMYNLSIEQHRKTKSQLN